MAMCCQHAVGILFVASRGGAPGSADKLNAWGQKDILVASLKPAVNGRSINYLHHHHH